MCPGTPQYRTFQSYRNQAYFSSMSLGPSSGAASAPTSAAALLMRPRCAQLPSRTGNLQSGLRLLLRVPSKRLATTLISISIQHHYSLFSPSLRPYPFTSNITMFSPGPFRYYFDLFDWIDIIHDLEDLPELPPLADPSLTSTVTVADVKRWMHIFGVTADEARYGICRWRSVTHPPLTTSPTILNQWP